MFLILNLLFLIVYYTIPVLQIIIVLLGYSLVLLMVVGYLAYTWVMVYSARMGAPYVPSSNRRLQDILSHAHIGPSDVFLDLGCGDGRVVFAASRKYGCKGRGIDISKPLIWVARLFAKIYGLSSKCEFKAEDIRKTHLADATVIYIFLFPQLVEQMQDRLMSLASGTRIISHGFTLNFLEKKLTHVRQDKPFSTYYYTL